MARDLAESVNLGRRSRRDSERSESDTERIETLQRESGSCKRKQKNNTKHTVECHHKLTVEPKNCSKIYQSINDLHTLTDVRLTSEHCQ